MNFLSELSREQQLIILGLILVIISGLGVMAYRRTVFSHSSEIVIEEPQVSSHKSSFFQIIVHISGGVHKQGVYKLKQGDRLVDLIDLAGGATVFADLSSLNLAEKLKDGQKITIPVKAIVVAGISGNQDIGQAGGSRGKININQASEQELCKVKGIGSSTAKKIINYRVTNGPFQKIEGLLKVKSIGKGKFGKIKELITI